VFARVAQCVFRDLVPMNFDCEGPVKVAIDGPERLFKSMPPNESVVRLA